MKIGDVETTKIANGERVACHNGCSTTATVRFNGTPYCDECLHIEQRRKWDADGRFFIRDGERIHFEVAQKVPSAER